MQKKKAIREFWDQISRLAHKIADYADANRIDNDPIATTLARVLGNSTGKLRLSAAYLIVGIEPGKASQDQIFRFGRAMRELGWQRMRRRFDGVLEYAYVKGSATEREVEFHVPLRQQRRTSQ